MSPYRRKPLSPSSGTYAIFRIGIGTFDALLLDIGECGPRVNSKPRGLRGRLATTVAHSSSQRLAIDVVSRVLPEPLYVVWTECTSKEHAKSMQDALLVLFKREFGHQPKYNTKVERCAEPDQFGASYESLKETVRDAAIRLPAT